MPEGCPDRCKVVQFILHGFDFSKTAQRRNNRRTENNTRTSHLAGPMVSRSRSSYASPRVGNRKVLARQPAALTLARQPA
eukprot:1598552-Prymnesium_polylepis.1